MLTDGISAGVNITGERINSRGRRFGYTEEEFLESYLGKDYARKIDLNDNHDNLIFGFQDTLKDLVPDKEKYLKLPKILKEQEQLEQIMGTYKVDGRTIDPKMGEYLEVVDINKIQNDHIMRMDIEHPSDPSRSYIKDIMNMIDGIKMR